MNWGMIGITIGVLVLIGAVVGAAVKAQQNYEAYLVTEMQNCVAAHETEYTCKAYIASLEAQHEAKSAQQSASFAAGMSAASMGYAAGSR